MPFLESNEIPLIKRKGPIRFLPIIVTAVALILLLGTAGAMTLYWIKGWPH